MFYSKTKALVEIWVNGSKYSVEVPPKTTLLELLRDYLKLTGTKRGCDEGECGACTVIVDNKAVNSCLLLAVKANGDRVFTVEGLAKDRELHPLQHAFIEQGGLQCGFCTPGMLMSAYALLKEVPSPNENDIKLAIAGNLCRCTGYQKIIQSIIFAADKILEERDDD